MSPNIHECRRCGEEYDISEQEPPEDAGMYWVPKCPECGQDISSPEVDEEWVEICLVSYRSLRDRLQEGKLFDWEDEEELREWTETFLERIQLWARHLHGR